MCTQLMAYKITIFFTVLSFGVSLFLKIVASFLEWRKVLLDCDLTHKLFFIWWIW